MDWKYKHFHQERFFATRRDAVLDAARTYMSGPLGWKIADTSGGFTAEGYSFSHQAKATVLVQPADGEGTRVSVDLAVNRAGLSGFMLFDVGGYYNIQIRKWLDGIQWGIDRQLTPGADDSANPHVPPNNKVAACLFNGCLVLIVAIFAIYAIFLVVSAVVGLITGNLYSFGSDGTLHGLWARIVSFGILLLIGLIGWRIRRMRRT